MTYIDRLIIGYSLVFFIFFSGILPLFACFRLMKLIKNRYSSQIRKIVFYLSGFVFSMVFSMISSAITFLSGFIYALSAKNIVHVTYMLFFVGLFSIYLLYRKRFVTSFLVFKLSEILLMWWASTAMNT